MQRTRSGFTIVELLIVIVVIAILATISVVAYNNVQARANDSRRLSDANSITKALGVYYAQNDRYPSHTSGGSWEQSDTELPGQFMEYLNSYGLVGGTPIDPLSGSGGSYRYSYYRYSAGQYGCDTNRGAYFVFGITRFQTSSGARSDSPGFSCSGRDWQNEYPWVTGGFER